MPTAKFHHTTSGQWTNKKYWIFEEFLTQNWFRHKDEAFSFDSTSSDFWLVMRTFFCLLLEMEKQQKVNLNILTYRIFSKQAKIDDKSNTKENWHWHVCTAQNHKINSISICLFQFLCVCVCVFFLLLSIVNSQETIHASGCDKLRPLPFISVACVWLTNASCLVSIESDDVCFAFASTFQSFRNWTNNKWLQSR